MLSPEVIEARRSGVGGSDAGAVAGLSRFATPVDIYLDKIGQAQPDEETEAMHFGNLLENIVAEEYARRTGEKVHRRNQIVKHPDLPWMIANVDRLVVGRKKGLECKTSSAYIRDKWGPSGTDQVPDDYLLQCMHYMTVTGRQIWDLAVLIGGNEFRHYTIPFDRRLADRVIEIEDEFWNQHVVPRVPPEPICFADIDALYPYDNGEELLATPELEAAVEQRKELKAKAKLLDKEIGELDLSIKKFFGSSAIVLKGENGKVLATYKSAKDSEIPDKDAMVKDGIFESYSKTKRGGRRLLIK